MRQATGKEKENKSKNFNKTPVITVLEIYNGPALSVDDEKIR